MSFGPKSLGGLMFVIIGGFSALYFAYGLGSIAWLSIAGETGTGVVSGYRHIPAAGRGGSSSRAQVTFRDTQGAEHVVEMRFSFSNRMSGQRRETHEVGERVRVLYPKGKPYEAIISDGTTIGWHLFLALFSSIFLTLGIWLIRADRKEQKELGWSRRRF